MTALRLCRGNPDRLPVSHPLLQVGEVEAEARPRAIAEPEGPELVSVRIHPVAVPPEQLRNLSGIQNARRLNSVRCDK